MNLINPETKLTFDALQISDAELGEAMGYGTATPDESVRTEMHALLRRVASITVPRFEFVIEEGTLCLEDDTLHIGGRTLHVGRIIARQLRGAEQYALFTASAGMEFENLQHTLEDEGDMVKCYLADCMGSIIAEKTADCMEVALQHAIDRALHNSLLNDNDNIFNAKRLLFVIYFSEEAELGMDEMQDIHDFMAHFKTEYEVKWGFGYDNTLGQQIKITILATGFGVDDILAEERGMEAEMDKRQAEEEERIRKQKEEEENAWIYQAYGEEIDIRPRAEVTILTMEQLDDDNAIALLEETPTYMRGRFSNSQPSRSASKSKQEDNASNKLTIQF